MNKNLAVEQKKVLNIIEKYNPFNYRGYRCFVNKVKVNLNCRNHIFASIKNLLQRCRPMWCLNHSSKIIPSLNTVSKF